MMKAIMVLVLCGVIVPVFGQRTQWGVDFSDAIISRYQPNINAMTGKDWDHANSIILHGMEKIYAHTGDKTYVQYIQSFVDDFVSNEGEVRGLKTELDGIHPGVLCLFLYQETGEERYQVAAQQMRDFLIGTVDHPSVFQKTPDGGYWHKNNDHYEQVMTVDGAYMSNPFLVKYGQMFDDSESLDVATFQTLLIASRSFNIESHLPYHGWNYAKNKSWSNAITGTSTEVWSRSVGWFSMALVDILDDLPATHSDYQNILYLFQQLSVGIKETQNQQGLWYQMVNHPSAFGNYIETSGSGMVIYALKKGMDKGWLDTSYEGVVNQAWNSMQTYISTNPDGLPQINSFNPGMGIKDNLDEYIKVRPVSCTSESEKQHPHGYCAILMAASVMEF
ncbi:glycoside hydrolase family 105 protein [Reichenbachiella sp. MSK19-1]|uniref:glycoside hydrolase family 88/105 protein n=1 Tax=Reichenbachiella sp. MSK19-1 TaxID=1897631 RepID=UPI001C870015|nr:glycoside hydrolase family 88 protein [Reichenbachiella sp. MSK19-1]